MITVLNMFTELGFGLKFSEHVIDDDDGTFKQSTIPMVYLGAYTFKFTNTGKIALESQFTDAYFEEVYESEHVCSATEPLRLILYAKY